MSDKINPEDAFRDNLKDLLVVAQRLSSLVRNVEDLVGIITLALDNDGQLQMIMSLVTAPQTPPQKVR